MDPRFHKYNSSSSSSSNVPIYIKDAEKKKLLLDNFKNSFRMLRIGWSGDVPMQYNIETEKEEYWLRLDFVNFEGWCTEKFLQDELRKFEENNDVVNK